MKIQSLKLNNFMLFESLDINFSKNINIISGENNTGKTAIMKLLYSALKSCNTLKQSKKDFTRKNLEELMVSKFQGCFRPDNDSIGRLVSRKVGSSNCDINIFLEEDNEIDIKFGSKQKNHLDMNYEKIKNIKSSEQVFIPPKEIISVSNFVSLYEEYHIDFEETYYDLAKLLQKPLKKGSNKKEQNNVLKNFEKILNGKINQKEGKFYLDVSGSGKFEMGLVSEGYRKLSTIIYLILSGSLNENSILFWDEPETNMNPKMIKPMTDAILELAKMGVQVFITTHDYFIQQSFNLVASFPKESAYKGDIRFFSLYRDSEGSVKCEQANSLSDLEYNSVMDEFDELYNRELGYIYDNK